MYNRSKIFPIAVVSFVIATIATVGAFQAIAQGPPPGSPGGPGGPGGPMPGTPGGPPLPPARHIPGITTPDQFPGACVDCHVNMPEQNLDVRLSTMMGAWTAGNVEPRLIEKAKAHAPAGVTITGKHPSVPGSLNEIPGACLQCHGKDSKVAPAFATMLHDIHLTGGDDNHFLTLFQGECTHCHKLDAANTSWSIPNGKEH
ncbi:MAG: hypothetical protein ACE15D_18005 [Candidatus Eisenbacteria bacterium]|nr:hypothetical protein [Candidatus Eisenbacteria bacterium]